MDDAVGRSVLLNINSLALAQIWSFLQMDELALSSCLGIVASASSYYDIKR